VDQIVERKAGASAAERRELGQLRSELEAAERPKAIIRIVNALGPLLTAAAAEQNIALVHELMAFDLRARKHGGYLLRKQNTSYEKQGIRPTVGRTWVKLSKFSDDEYDAFVRLMSDKMTAIMLKPGKRSFVTAYKATVATELSGPQAPPQTTNLRSPWYTDDDGCPTRFTVAVLQTEVAEAKATGDRSVAALLAAALSSEPLVAAAGRRRSSRGNGGKP
jgi:hypothetical protein